MCGGGAQRLSFLRGKVLEAPSAGGIPRHSCGGASNPEFLLVCC